MMMTLGFWFCGVASVEKEMKYMSTKAPEMQANAAAAVVVSLIPDY